MAAITRKDGSQRSSVVANQLAFTNFTKQLLLQDMVGLLRHFTGNHPVGGCSTLPESSQTNAIWRIFFLDVRVVRQ